jgi:serine phosphatase RsbU (regulator of sigma subunit)
MRRGKLLPGAVLKPDSRSNDISRRQINLARISHINRKITSPMNLPELLAVILDIAKELMNAEGASLLLTDEETEDLIFNIVQGGRGEIKGDRLPKGVGIAGSVAQTGEAIIANDAQADPRFFKDIDNKYNFHTRNIIAVPMKVMDRLVGVLETINSIDRDVFDEWDEKLLNYLAELAAIAISNRKLYYELTSRIDMLTSLYEISQSISSSNMGEDLFHTIIQSIAHSLSVERASIILYDAVRDELVLKAAVGLPHEVHPESEIDMMKTISGFVYKNGDPLIVSDIAKETSFPFTSTGRSYHTRSFISVPVRHKNQTIGVINLADKKNAQSFDSFDLRVLSTVGNQIAEIYQNIQFQKRMMEQRRLEQEIDIASEIQAKILPDLPVSFKNHGMAAFTRPAKEIGGDFYDFFRFDENKYGIVVADVSGKGIPAALFMGMARNIIRAESRVSNLPGNILTNSNRYIHQDSEHGMFVTVIYLLIDTHNSIITFGSGGHNDQLLIRKNGEAVRLNASGRALGVDPDAAFEEKVVIYGPGDILLLFTDGLLESLGDTDIDRGEEAIIDIVRANPGADPAGIIAAIQERLEAVSLDAEFVDDITLFTVKF